MAQGGREHVLGAVLPRPLILPKASFLCGVGDGVEGDGGCLKAAGRDLSLEDIKGSS